MTDTIYLDETMTRTSFLNEARYGVFLIPENYVNDQICSDLRKEGFKASWGKAISGRLSFRALRVAVGKTGEERQRRLARAVNIVFGTRYIEPFPGLIRDRVLPIVAPTDTQVTIDLRQIKETDSKLKERQQQAVKAYTPVLRRLAQIMGTSVFFHSHEETTAPPSADDGMIHIHTNCSPPGEHVSWYVDTAFGMKISPLERDLVGYGPTEGRGVILKDADKKNVAQILGNNWYIFFPTLSYFNEATSVQILECTLSLCLETHSHGPVANNTLDHKTFLKTMKEWADGSDGVADREIKKIQKDLEVGRLRMTELTRDLRMWISLKEGFHASAFVRTARRRMAGDLQKIMEHPLVAGADFFQDALQVRTVPLTTHHEEAAYHTGPFTIRINKHGKVSVWSEEPTHPSGVPHPHISKHEGPCFGNAGTAIIKAAAEMRYLDTISYILTWLTHGYTHDLAAVKIQEWPIVKASGGDIP